MKINKADICCGLSYGDEGKGKLVAYLARTNDYDFVCRWNGGHNAGHTIYVDGIKYKTNLIPSGIFYGIKSYIGPNCVINVSKFIKELEYLKNNGFDITLVSISPKCSVITDKHLSENVDNPKYSGDTSTNTGIAPCYSDKYGRTGILSKDVPLLTKYIFNGELYGNILCEGAQGFWLDINHGNYPYTTSSHTLPYDACSIGFPPKIIGDIYGAWKIYDTRVGIDPDFPDTLFEDKELNKLIDIGEEYGVTTGRKRKTNWLNLDKLIYSINVSGVNIVCFSKIDIIQKVGIYKLFFNRVITEFNSIDSMKKFINDTIESNCKINKINYSGSIDTIY